MPIKIRIKNFQSIGDVSFDISGFTVIVGKNNLGKSAIVRAIDGALNNRAGTEFIRWGKTKSEVHFKKDGLDIEWDKGESSTTYKVNGNSFTKLNKTVPQPILDAGIRKIEVGDQKFNPLVAHQFKELFLIDQPGSVVTDVLSVMYKLNVLGDADDLCLKELRTKKALLKTREADLDFLKIRLDNFKDFDALKEEIKALHAVDEKCTALRAEKDYLDKVTKDLERLKVSTEALEKLTRLDIPSISPAEAQLSEIKWLGTTTMQYGQITVNMKLLEQTNAAVLPDPSSAKLLLDEMQNVAGYTNALRTILPSVKALEGATKIQIPDLGPLQQMMTESQELFDFHAQFTTSAREVKGLKKELEKLESDLKAAREEYSTFTVCPACQRPL